MRGFFRRLSAAGQARRAFRVGVRRSELRGEDRRGDSRHHFALALLTGLFLTLLPAVAAYAAPFPLVFSRDVLYLINSDSENKKTAKIEEDVRATNTRLDGFSLTRDGDMITLGFDMWTDKAKVSFTLKGEKFAFYRMSMGVSLESTAQALIEGDANLSLAGTGKDDKSITLHLRHKDADVTKVVIKEKVTPSDNINREFLEAMQSKDPKQLEAFAKKYPNSPKTPKALEAATRHKEETAYEQAAQTDTLAGYKAFLKAYPDTRRREQVQKRIDEFEAEEKAKTAKREKEAAAKQAKADQAVNSAFAAAKKAGTVQALEQFRKAHPKSRHDKEAENLIAAKMDDDAYARSQHSTKGLNDYLASYPTGRHAKEAKERIAEQKKASENARSTSIEAVRVKTAPKIDGDSGDAAWQAAPRSRIALKAEKGVTAAEVVDVRAVHDGTTLYLMAQWRDKTEDRTYRPWVRNDKKKYTQSQQVDDAFSVALFKGKTPAEACMLAGGEMDADIWLWRAFWSELSGLASDQRIVTSTQRLPKSNPFIDKSGRGQVWMQNLPDKGRPGWNFDVPLPSKTQAATVPSYIPAKAQGSVGDVRARANWRDGLWTVEFARKLDTGQPDDTPISSKGPTMVSFAIFDHEDHDRHSASTFIRLELGGP